MYTRAANATSRTTGKPGARNGAFTSGCLYRRKNILIREMPQEIINTNVTMGFCL